MGISDALNRLLLSYWEPHACCLCVTLQNEEETASVARVLEYYISNYGALSRRVYWTPSGNKSHELYSCRPDHWCSWIRPGSCFASVRMLMAKMQEF